MASILLLESSRIFTNPIASLLAGKGHETLSAGDGYKGLMMVAENLPDVIVAEMELPGINGIELMRQLPAGNGYFPGKIVLGGRVDADIDRECLLRAMNIVWVEKERWEADLAAALDQVLRMQEMVLAAWEDGRKNPALYCPPHLLQPVLNALPVHIALLNAGGVVMRTNRAWREDGRTRLHHEIGYCYLDDHGMNMQVEERYLLARVREVITRRNAGFSVHYPERPTLSRRYLFSAREVADTTGTLLSFVEITPGRDKRIRPRVKKHREQQ